MSASGTVMGRRYAIAARYPRLELGGVRGGSFALGERCRKFVAGVDVEFVVGAGEVFLDGGFGENSACAISVLLLPSAASDAVRRSLAESASSPEN
jgi:hypothetical protein